jgi:hypothetical protein
MLPARARARGMAVYLVVFQGGNAIGSAVFGIVAAGDLNRTVGVAAAGLAAGPALAFWRRLPHIEADELAPAADQMPAALLATAERPKGPVMVSVEYRAAAGRADGLLQALGQLRRARRRTGAVSWRVWRDAADPDLVLEQFVVGSWEEHERQHARFSIRDRERLDLAVSLTADGTSRVRHWAVADVRGGIAPDPRSLADR